MLLTVHLSFFWTGSTHLFTQNVRSLTHAKYYPKKGPDSLEVCRQYKKDSHSHPRKAASKLSIERPQSSSEILLDFRLYFLLHIQLLKLLLSEGKPILRSFLRVLHSFYFSFFQDKMKSSILLTLSLCSSAFAAVARRSGKVQYAGVNIAGCDFGMQTDVSSLFVFGSGAV